MKRKLWYLLAIVSVFSNVSQAKPVENNPMSTPYTRGGFLLSKPIGTEEQASAAPYVAIGVTIDNVRGPQNLFDVARSCSANNLCAGLLAAAEYFSGLPVSQVVGIAALLSRNVYGEGTESNLTLPSGYAYCMARVHTVSIVPNGGDRGSLLLTRADGNGLNVQTWTPVLPPFDGRSWVEANITLIGVRNDLAEASYRNDGPCYRPNSRVFLYCRGGGCEVPRTTDDRGQAVDASSPPGAGSRK